jgi:hypothetical protein
MQLERNDEQARQAFALQDKEIDGVTTAGSARWGADHTCVQRFTIAYEYPAVFTRGLSRLPTSSYPRRLGVAGADLAALGGRNLHLGRSA